MYVLTASAGTWSGGKYRSSIVHELQIQAVRDAPEEVN